jgi:hypothetical protein
VSAGLGSPRCPWQCIGLVCSDARGIPAGRVCAHDDGHYHVRASTFVSHLTCATTPLPRLLTLASVLAHARTSHHITSHRITSHHITSHHNSDTADLDSFLCASTLQNSTLRRALSQLLRCNSPRLSTWTRMCEEPTMRAHARTHAHTHTHTHTYCNTHIAHIAHTLQSTHAIT